MSGHLFRLACAGLALLSACASGEGARQPAASSAKASVVRVGISDIPFPPFSVQDASGAWHGFDIDLARAICETEHLSCQFVSIPWERFLSALQEREIDVFWSSLQVTDEREKVMDFTDRYYLSKYALIGRASDNTVPNIASPSSLSGKRVGAQTLTATARFLEQRFGGAVAVKQYDRMDDALADLKVGRLDYVSEAMFFLSPFLKQNPDFAVKVIWPLDPILNQGVAGGLRKGDTTLRATLNKGLATLVRNGEYDKILATYPGLGEEISKPTY